MKYTPDNRPVYPWVKVEDGLPEHWPETVMAVFNAKYGSRFVAKAYYHENDWYFNDDDVKALDVGCHATHWQYLPALP